MNTHAPDREERVRSGKQLPVRESIWEASDDDPSGFCVPFDDLQDGTQDEREFEEWRMYLQNREAAA